ncbi:MAG: hypothetical protein QNK37_02010 [Acidobacteriota bacterium]|nr:hypothetical protein [Acidobacteriota bacterium]
MRAIFVADAPEGYVTMKHAIKRLGVSRRAVLQRVKDGKLETVHVRKGRHKGIRIKVLDDQPGLFEDFHE